MKLLTGLTISLSVKKEANFYGVLVFLKMEFYLGTISKIEDDRIASVEISENVKVQVVRSTITEVISANNNKKK